MTKKTTISKCTHMLMSPTYPTTPPSSPGGHLLTLPHLASFPSFIFHYSPFFHFLTTPLHLHLHSHSVITSLSHADAHIKHTRSRALPLPRIPLYLSISIYVYLLIYLFIYIHTHLPTPAPPYLSSFISRCHYLHHVRHTAYTTLWAPLSPTVIV